MSDTTKQVLDLVINLLVGNLVPFLISYIKDTRWSDRQKMLLAIGVSVVIGILSSLLTNGLILHREMSLDDWMANILAVYGGATAAYKLWMQKTETNTTLEQIGPFKSDTEASHDPTTRRT